MTNSIIKVFSGILLLAGIYSCDKGPAEQCQNGLNVNEFDDCECPVETLQFSGYPYNTCRELNANEWKLTINDSCFIYREIVFNVPDSTALLETPEGFEKMDYAMEVLNGETNALLWGLEYHLIPQANGIDSVFIDFRPIREPYSFCEANNEGFFISGSIQNGEPKHLYLNHGIPGERFGFETVSSTPILISK